MSQVLLKYSTKKYSSSLNKLAFLSFALLGIVTILIVYALQAVPLKSFIALNFLSFVIMPFAAFIFLGEKLKKRSVVAAFLISTGIIVFLNAD